MALNTAQRRSPQVAPLERKDTWWIEPVLMATALILFLVYGTWRAFENNYYDTVRMGLAMHYLSPFYSPPLQDWFRTRLPISAAFLLLGFPGSFRASCYFCRRSYYRALFWDPPACAVREIAQARRKNYTGERAFPFVLQNLHRYALYAIFVFVVFHWIHLFQAFRFHGRFGIGVGTLVFGFDTLMLSAYVFSCHSFRHLVGGLVNKFSGENKVRHALWSKVTMLNAWHGLFFWLSLFSVGLADVYVRLVCTGAIHDFYMTF